MCVCGRACVCMCHCAFVYVIVLYMSLYMYCCVCLYCVCTGIIICTYIVYVWICDYVCMGIYVSVYVFVNSMHTCVLVEQGSNLKLNTILLCSQSKSFTECEYTWCNGCHSKSTFICRVCFNSC